MIQDAGKYGSKKGICARLTSQIVEQSNGPLRWKTMLTNNNNGVLRREAEIEPAHTFFLDHGRGKL